jgi:hypothetical protein
MGPRVTLSTRALWFRAARAKAVEARRSNSFEFELQGVRYKDGVFAALVAHSHVPTDSPHVLAFV